MLPLAAALDAWVEAWLGVYAAAAAAESRRRRSLAVWAAAARRPQALATRHALARFVAPTFAAWRQAARRAALRARCDRRSPPSASGAR